MTWNELDRLARDANNGDLAAADRLRDVASNVNDPDTLLNIAERYPTGEEAGEILARRALELEPKSERAWEALASVYDLYDGQWLNERTRLAVEQLLAVNPANLVALRICLAHAHLCRDFARARELAESILRVDPLNFSGTVALAKLLTLEGQKHAALSSIDMYIDRVGASDRDDREELIRLSLHRRAQIESGESEQGVWP